MNYDPVAHAYDRRYELHDYPGVRAALLRDTFAGAGVLELGCGTGKWLADLAAAGFVYDYFPETLQLDRSRFPSLPQRTEWLHAAGFTHFTVEVAERLRWSGTRNDAHRDGLLDQSCTSQLQAHPRAIHRRPRAPSRRLSSRSRPHSLRDARHQTCSVIRVRSL